MTRRHPVTLDCIIFGLQQFGGISNYWARLVDHVGIDPALAGRLVLPGKTLYRDFDRAWSERMPILQERLAPRIARYLGAPASSDGGVFHTSYYRLPRWPVARYVVSVYDFTYERYRSGLARIVHSRQKLASIRRADAVLCISESTRRDVLEFCPGIEPERLHVIHLGVDHSVFYRHTAASQAADAQTADTQTVLFVGQRGGYKRFDLAVDAVRQLPRLSLGVVGPAVTLQERAQLDKSLGSRWREFGPVSNAELRKLYTSAFAFIFPSDYEGFGLPVLEAMASGCPVLAATTSSLPEVGGSAARYALTQNADDYAAALALLDSAAVRSEMVRAGLARAAGFDWSRTLAHTVSVYLEPVS